jgi:hypothetical protein
MYDDAAKERQKAAIKERDDKGRAKPVPDNCSEVVGKGEARDQVGQAFGVSGTNSRQN